MSESATATAIAEPPQERAGPEAETGPDPNGWWRGPGGGREVLAVATPMVVSSLSWTIMTFIDRMMLNHWSGDAMAAAFNAGVVWWLFVCLPLGVCSYASTFVAQYHGSGRLGRIGPVVWQAVWVALAFSPLLLALIPMSAAMFRAAGHDESIVALETTYFTILTYGSPAMLLSGALACFWTGRGQTVLVMVVDAVFASLNLLLDWWWIFGVTLTVGGEAWEVFPPGGVAGAAWATTTAMWAKTVVYAVLLVARRNRGELRSTGWRLERGLIHRLLRFGVPSGLQWLVEVAGFTAFIVVVGRLGAVENQATSMTFSIGHLAFMPVVGLGGAASVLVGQHLGENRDRAAARSTWTTLHVAWAYMVAISAAFVFAPQWFLGGFFVGEAIEGDPAERAAVAATAVVLLRFVAAYNLLDATMITVAGALKGAGDTRFVLTTSALMAPLLGVGAWSAEALGAGIYGCWAVVACWIGGLAAIFFARFLGGAWRSMRVIEPEVV
ncbi:MAG: MATE family efflux transporter [Planctomycetota bacterium]